jgi:lipopolysaccharide cholinephosphotransferase
MLDRYVRLSFGNDVFPCVAGWDHHLRVLYGDYMQLPPEEERVWKHHPVCIDFEKNYEERT